MEENKENVVEETTQENVTKVEIKETPQDDNITKVNLDQPIKKEEEDATEKQSTDEVPVRDGSETSEEVREENKEKLEESTEQSEKEEQEVVLEEVTEDSTEEEVAEVEEQVEEAIAEAEATGKPLPENIQKLVDFMEETGGDINDYVKINQDYSKLDDDSLLREYYRQTKPHLNAEEINFLMEDSFSYEEEEDEERDIRRKKLALKEQVADARSHLDGQKSKYYEEIKAGSKLTPEQQKAVDFFNRYNKESEETKKIAESSKSNFLNKTNKVFNDKFKGFEYNVGDKRYRFNINNAKEVKETQSDINNFVKKFLNEKNEMSDAAGYHKSLYTAMNADAIAKHFYEQGKADAMKNSIAKAKNVDMNPRQSHGTIEAGGVKVKVLGETTSDFKFKIKNNK